MKVTVSGVRAINETETVTIKRKTVAFIYPPFFCSFLFPLWITKWKSMTPDERNLMLYDSTVIC